MNTTRRRLLYVVIAWILIICYSILQISIVESVILLSPITPPNNDVKQLIVFVYGLAVVSFMGGSQIPAVFIKKKSYTVQFVFNAIFGFILLLVTFLNESAFTQLNDSTLIPFFTKYPSIALEYLSIPYIVMIFLDLHLHGHLTEFCWRDCHEYLTSLVRHPCQTLETIFYHQSVLYSLFSIILVSVAWTLREVVLSFQTSFTLSRWLLTTPNIGESFDPLFRASLMIPIGLSLWLFGSALVHILAEGLGGESRFLEVATLLGVSFLPSSMIIVVDLLELGTVGFGIPAIFFQIVNIVILVVWPFILITISIRISKNLPLLKAIPSAVAPILLMLILVVEGIV